MARTLLSAHLGFEPRDDIDLGFMRWLTVGIRDMFGNHVRISQPNTASPQEVKDTYEEATS